MTDELSSWFMMGLNSMMIVYTLWVLSLAKAAPGRMAVGIGMFVWLAVLYLGISTKSLFPEDISGIAMLLTIFAGVGGVGVLLFSITPLRRLLLGLTQQQLMLFQGIRVFYGATFLMQASLGNMPLAFGIVDGWTHISAGFFGLVAAFSFASAANGVRRAWFANIFGLLDILIVASSIALILLPEIGPHHSIMYAVFLPAPLWLWFHLISIRKLLLDKGESVNALP